MPGFWVSRHITCNAVSHHLLLSLQCDLRVFPAHPACSLFPLWTARTPSHWGNKHDPKWPQQNIQVSWAATVLKLMLCRGETLLQISKPIIFYVYSLSNCLRVLYELEPTLDQQHTVPAPGRRLWMREECERHYPPLLDSPTLRWLSRLYR